MSLRASCMSQKMTWDPLRCDRGGLGRKHTNGGGELNATLGSSTFQKGTLKLGFPEMVT